MSRDEFTLEAYRAELAADTAALKALSGESMSDDERRAALLWFAKHEALTIDLIKFMERKIENDPF